MQPYIHTHLYTWIRRRQWQPTPVLLPGKSHGRRSLVGCSPWGRWESDTTEQLHFHSSLSCIGEGNGNPLQCSYLKNPRDGGAGGLPSLGSHRVRHDWSDLAAAAAYTWITHKCLSQNLRSHHWSPLSLYPLSSTICHFFIPSFLILSINKSYQHCP